MNKGLIYDGCGLYEATWDEDSYSFLKESVEGLIEHVCLPTFDDRGIDVWCNDEGKLIGLEPTLVLGVKGRLYEVLNGTLVFTRYNDEGETLSLTDDDIKFIRKVFKEMPYVMYVDDKFRCPIPYLEYEGYNG